MSTIPISTKPRVALVGGETPLGADMRDVLHSSILGGRVKLVGSDESGDAVLSEEGGEPVVITALDGDELNAAQVVFFAGSEASTRKAFGKIAPGQTKQVLVDVTRGLESRPEARLRAPMVEPSGYLPGEGIHVVAHPAAIMAAAIARAVETVRPVTRAVVTAFEPASERGRAGIDELQQQTLNLLQFQGVPKAVFGEQLAFNLLSRFGPDAKESLASIEERVEGHLASLIALSPSLPMPSLRLLQAPVMHGVSLSCWLELDGEVEPLEVQSALAEKGFDVRGEDLEGPDVVGMAAQEGIAIGPVTRDRNNRKALWIWAVADNYRLVAQEALSVARAELIRSLS